MSNIKLTIDGKELPVSTYKYEITPSNEEITSNKPNQNGYLVTMTAKALMSDSNVRIKLGEIEGAHFKGATAITKLADVNISCTDFNKKLKFTNDSFITALGFEKDTETNNEYAVISIRLGSTGIANAEFLA